VAYLVTTEPIWSILAEHASKIHKASQWGFGAGSEPVDQEVVDAIGYAPTEEQHQHLMDLAQVLHDTGIHSSERLAARLGYELVETPNAKLPHTYLRFDREDCD
jgi:hypothetical protein